MSGGVSFGCVYTDRFLLRDSRQVAHQPLGLCGLILHQNNLLPQAMVFGAQPHVLPVHATTSPAHVYLIRVHIATDERQCHWTVRCEVPIVGAQRSDGRVFG